MTLYGSVSDFENSIIVEEKKNGFRLVFGKIILGSILLTALFCAAAISQFTVGGLSIAQTFSASRPTEGSRSSVKALTTTYSPATHKSTGIQFTTYRVGYSPLEYFSETPSKVLKYKILDGFVGIVEPYVNMHLKLYGVADSESSEYSYSVCDQDNDCTEFSFPQPFKSECTPSDTFHVKVMSSDGEIVASGSLLCIYVRREIRSLTKDDLSTAISAIWKMWSVDQDEGEALYGSNYLNYARLLEYHYFNAGWQDSDHIHEGKGFLPQHMKMIFYFSKSLTAVDPSVSLFYWDFT